MCVWSRQRLRAGWHPADPSVEMRGVLSEEAVNLHKLWLRRFKSAQNTQPFTWTHMDPLSPVARSCNSLFGCMVELINKVLHLGWNVYSLTPWRCAALFTHSKLLAIVWNSKVQNTIRSGDISASLAIKLYLYSWVSKKDEASCQRALSLKCADSCSKQSAARWSHYGVCANAWRGRWP